MMASSRDSTRHRGRGRGFALVAALFLLTIAAAVGAVMMRKLQYQSTGRDLMVSGTRARFAAAAGIQWVSYRIARNGGPCVAGTLNLTEAALRGYRVTVSCARSVHGGGAGARSSYALDALAQWGTYGTADYAAFRQTGTLIR